jgi:hypothetical protein
MGAALVIKRHQFGSNRVIPTPLHGCIKLVWIVAYPLYIEHALSRLIMTPNRIPN